MKAAKRMSPRPASFVIRHRKLVEESSEGRRESSEGRKENNEGRKKENSEGRKKENKEENMLTRMHLPTLGSRKKTTTQPPEEKPKLTVKSCRHDIPNTKSWKTVVKREENHSGSTKENIKMPVVPKVDLKPQRGPKNVAKKESVVTAPKLAIKKPIAGEKVQKENSRPQKPKMPGKVDYAPRFPSLSPSTVKDMKRDDKTLVKNWSTIVMVNDGKEKEKKTKNQTPNESTKGPSQEEKPSAGEGSKKGVKQDARTVGKNGRPWGIVKNGQRKG